MNNFLTPFKAFDDFFEDMLTVSDQKGYLSEDDNNFYYDFEVPGIKKEDLKIEIKNDYLTLSADSKLRNRSYSIRKTILIPKNVKTDNIVANLENGILYLTIEKNEVNRPRLVQIK